MLIFCLTAVCSCQVWLPTMHPPIMLSRQDLLMGRLSVELELVSTWVLLLTVFSYQMMFRYEVMLWGWLLHVHNWELCMPWFLCCCYFLLLRQWKTIQHADVQLLQSTRLSEEHKYWYLHLFLTLSGQSIGTVGWIVRPSLLLTSAGLFPECITDAVKNIILKVPSKLLPIPYICSLQAIRPTVTWYAVGLTEHDLLIKISLKYY